ncbi:MAG: carotenoid biosynthesis protein [Syntrophobacter sp.]
MPDVFGLLWGTVTLRPYVFAFLVVYIVAGCAHIGWRKTLIFIPAGYVLAWISEFSSIHWGFPYGDYFYIPTTIDRELWVFGVPFMDSLSYVFLSYCSYSLAVFLMSPLTLSSGCPVVHESPSVRRSFPVLVLGAFLFTMLDVIIDPVALLGERWFLGKIYGYRQAGFYFGIPMSNFGGWVLVGAVLVGAQQWLDRLISPDPVRPSSSLASLWMRFLGPILYFSVMIFNIAVTFRIQEYLLGFVDLMLFFSLVIMMFFFTWFKIRHPAPVLAPF